MLVNGLGFLAVILLGTLAVVVVGITYGRGRVYAFIGLLLLVATLAFLLTHPHILSVSPSH